MTVIVTPAIRKIYRELLKQVVEDLHKPMLVFSPPTKEDCPNCFIVGTKVNTPFGPKSIEDLVAGDLVFDAFGAVQEVVYTSAREVHTGITTVKTWGNGLGLSGTSDHKVIAYVNNGSTYKPILGTREDKTLSDLSLGDILVKPIVELPHTALKHLEPKWKCSKYGPQKDVPPIIQVTDEFLYAYGLYLAEGCTSKGRQVQYCLNTSELGLGERVCAYWKGLLDISWSRCGRVGSDKNAVFELYSSHLSNFLDDYAGHLAENKRICDDLYYHLNKEQTMVMVRALFDGDGHTEQPGRYVLNQTSEVLAHQVYNLLLSCGYAATISWTDSRVGSDGITRLPIYTVRYWDERTPRGMITDSSRAYQTVRDVSTTCTTTTVYNIEVTGSHTYDAGGFSVHNCVYDFVNKTSSGNFQTSFVTPVVIFGETINPSSFQRGRCPVCYGEGHLESTIKRNVKALVKWNPGSADDIESLPVGREGHAVVRIKVLRADFDLVNDAVSFIVDGVRCEMLRPPTIRGLGTQEELVIAFLQEVEPGKDVKK